MSNKGAIKKTNTSKDERKSNVRSKPNSLRSTEDLEGPGKLVLRRSKKPQDLEQGGGGDRLTSLIDNAKSTRSISRQPDAPAQRKSVREILSSNSKVNKTGIKNVPKKTSVSNTRQDSMKKFTTNKETKSQTTGKNQTGYSEKRGLSTIYMPRSNASKLSSRSVDQKARSNSNDKEKLSHRNATVGNKAKIVPRERKLSRTLSPSEVRVLHSAITRSDPSQRTDKHEQNLQKSNAGDNYVYEDDFEDYESDFQECTESDVSQISEESNSGDSDLQLDPIELRAEQRETVKSASRQKNEEEHMHDSGHYELAEARRRAARVELMIANQSKSSPVLELRQPINKSYSEDRPSENKSLPSSTDEGFEDSRSGDFPKSPPLSQISFIDFHKSLQNQSVKKTKKTLSRGEELLEMIKLDVMEWSLLECTPIPYEEFIRSYGKLNAQQTSTQTGEDNIDVEIQTDKITSHNKWTQFPISCRKKIQSKGDIRLFRMDQVGVGSDNDAETGENLVSTPSFDALRLSEFVNRAGTVMLSLLEERRFRGNVFKNEKHQLPFSDGVLKLFVNSVTFLAGRPVTIIHYSEVLNKVLLTVHSPVEEEIETSSKQDYITDCCVGCVWNISEPSMPIKLFYSSCPITACCFHLTNYNVVFAGLQDGSISLWDLKEDEMWHQKVTDKANELDWILRSPTYTTAAGTEINSHDSAIVAIRIQSKIELIEGKSIERRNNRFVPIQICSLDEEGSFIVWSVLHNMGMDIDDLGLSYWGDIRLVRNSKMAVKLTGEKKVIKTATFVDMHVDCVDTNNLYAATNTTSVLHANCIGNKPNPALYSESDTNPCGSTTCVEMCPFERSFFLVGCDDGTIRLHSSNVEKPILQLKDEDSWVKIKTVQWSKTKPFTIYILDNNSRICIWDLGNSDIHPSHTINMQKRGRINAMQLSSCKTERDMTHQYLALGTESGNVEIHKLKADFCYSRKEHCLQELNTFLRYIAIL